MNFFDILFEASDREIKSTYKKEKAKQTEDYTSKPEGYSIKTNDGRKMPISEKEYNNIEDAKLKEIKLSKRVDNWVSERDKTDEKNTKLNDTVLDSFLNKISKAVPHIKDVEPTLPEALEKIEKKRQKWIEEEPEKEEFWKNKPMNFGADELASLMYKSPVLFMQVLYIMYEKVLKGQKLAINYNDQLGKIFQGIKDGKSLQDITSEVQTENSARRSTKQLRRQRFAIIQKIKDFIQENDEAHSVDKNYTNSEGSNLFARYSAEMKDLAKTIAIIDAQINDWEQTKTTAEKGMKDATVMRTHDSLKKLSEDEDTASLESKLDQASKDVVQDIRNKNIVKNKDRHISQEQFLKLNHEQQTKALANYNLKELQTLKQNVEARAATIHNALNDTKEGHEAWREQRAAIKNIDKELENPATFKKKIKFMHDMDLENKIDELIELNKKIESEMSDDTVLLGWIQKGKKGQPDEVVYSDHEIHMKKSKTDPEKIRILEPKPFIKRLMKIYFYKTGTDIQTQTARVINKIFFGNDKVPKMHSTRALHIALSRMSKEKEAEIKAKQQEEKRKRDEQISQDFSAELNKMNPQELKDKKNDNLGKIQDINNQIIELSRVITETSEAANKLRKKAMPQEKAAEIINNLHQEKSLTPEQKKLLKDTMKKYEVAEKISDLNKIMVDNKAKIKNLENKKADIKEDNKRIDAMLQLLRDQSRTGDSFTVGGKISDRIEQLNQRAKDIGSWQKIQELISKRMSKKK